MPGFLSGTTAKAKIMLPTLAKAVAVAVAEEVAKVEARATHHGRMVALRCNCSMSSHALDTYRMLIF